MNKHKSIMLGVKNYFSPSEGFQRQERVNREGVKMVKLMDSSKPWFGHGFVVALCVTLLIKSMFLTWVRIPSGSMSTTLEIGDWVLVNNSAYSLRIPFTKDHITTVSSPERGDVVTYKAFVGGRNRTLIKRVIGVSGDHIRVDGTDLYLNGTKLKSSMVDTLDGYGIFKQELGDKSFFIQYKRGSVTDDEGWRQGEWSVPEGHVFLMGDNRDNSYDSRFVEMGFVPLGDLMGKGLTVMGQFKPSTLSVERVGCSLYDTLGQKPMDSKCL